MARQRRVCANCKWYVDIPSIGMVCDNPNLGWDVEPEPSFGCNQWEAE